jgi:alpha-galactosidase
LKITFIGAGSSVFAKNILGDCMLVPDLEGFEFALFDIDKNRLAESKKMLENLRRNLNNKINIIAYDDRKKALTDAKYVINAIQVGGYKPSTVIDFEIPKRYGLRQTIGDTVGIGGIFRGLRTIPVMMDFAKDIQEVCPDAWLLNYTNPMAILTGAMIRYGHPKTVGLCHSVQVCVPVLLNSLNMDADNIQAKIAGINHMAWLLEITREGEDLYPEIKRRAKEKQKTKHHDMVRFEMMNHFGYYVTESSEHSAEYYPYFIKEKYPELINAFNIPLDEYLRRCEEKIAGWNKMKEELVGNLQISHTRTDEYASYIIEAMENNHPIKIAGNVLNKEGLISNLPQKACVEVPCLVDRSSIAPCYVGELPEQLAALNRTNINTQLMTIEAAMSHKKEHIYQAALLDPHTSSELSIDNIISLCNELIEAHGSYLPNYH